MTRALDAFEIRAKAAVLRVRAGEKRVRLHDEQIAAEAEFDRLLVRVERRLDAGEFTRVPAYRIAGLAASIEAVLAKDARRQELTR